jgi:hypothetical protein
MKSNSTKNEVHHSRDRAVISEVVAMTKTTEKTKITYNFFNHFHPFVGEFIEQLNKKSLAGLFDVDFQSELGKDLFLFSWSKVPGSDSERLLRHLKEGHNVSWAEIAEIQKSNNGRIIKIFPEESHDYEGSAEIWIDKNEENAILEIDGIKISALKVKHENGELNIYINFFEDDYHPNRNDKTLEVNYPKKEIDLSEGGSYSVYNWELFFHAPLTIAVHLSKNQRFAEAQRWFHFIFDPTSNDETVKPPMRFWKFRQFRESDVELINERLMSLSKSEDGELSELGNQILKNIEEWRNNPFQPHVVARNRDLAYQFYVVMKYLDNLIAWGDVLFRQDTIETINEATQIYVLAANILGPKPQKIPRMGTQPKTYAMLKGKLDPLGNALRDMEGQFPLNLNIPSTRNSATSQTNSLFGIAKTLYFCIPQNDKLLGYWDTVADRLFKIRHCMNIEGIVRQLPLFEPPIDPGMLVKAAAAGIDISSVVSGLNQPVSLVRAPLIIQKALEISSEVKTMGNALLSALEKKDAEELALLRQGHEIKILQLVEDVKYLQWKESEAAIEALMKTREITYQRYRHYQLILGKKDEDLKEIKDIANEKKELNEDNFDEVYNELVGRYGNPLSLEEYLKEQKSGDLIGQAAGAVSGILGSGDGANLQLNSSESKELNTFMPLAHELQQQSAVVETIASVLSLIPQFDIHGTPMGVGVATGFGGRQLSTFTSIGAKIIRLGADEMSYRANRASKLASYQRRIDDWVLQNNLAASELMQIGRQIISSLIREQIVKNEYENHKKQIEHAQEIDTFLKDKFTNRDFYVWMQSEISKIYYESYKFAFDIAKKAEQTMKLELMRKELDDMNFIKFNYWDSGRKGLLSGEALYLDLKRMEMAYHDHNKREYEMTKHVSLQQLNPNALLQLKATGSCEITIPEWLFDMDGPGHYMRRIKTVSLSIPCVTGPYTSINCTLSLLKSTIRQTSLLKGGGYGREGSEDDRFKDYFGAIQSIVTSSGQNDSGLFETNLRDERYLPFEGAGTESTWKLELPIDFKQFDYNTISDVILHLRYTAREGGTQLKGGAVDKINEIVVAAETSGLARSFSLKHDFPTEWHRFVNSTGTTEKLSIVIKKDHFPYIAQGFDINISKIQLFAIKDGELKPRNIGLENLSGDINTDNQCELAIVYDADVLNRKEEQVFLVLSYSKPP